MLTYLTASHDTEAIIFLSEISKWLWEDRGWRREEEEGGGGEEEEGGEGEEGGGSSLH